MTTLELSQMPNGLVGLRLPTLTGRVFVPLREIIRLEGQRNYTLFVLNNGKEILVAKTIGLFEEILPTTFVRVRRGCIINLSYLNGMKEGRFYLKDGFEVPVSRRRVKQFEAVRQAA
jgi:two-component system LytT family response regulator